MPPAQFALNPAQQAVLTDKSSRLLVGPPGSGKTLLLGQLAAQALAAGTPAAKIALTTFGWRATVQLAQQAATMPGLATPLTKLAYAPLTDWILPILQAAQPAGAEPLNAVSNNEIRRLLRGLIASQQFTGSLKDAENFIRSARNRARKLPENDPNYGFYDAYNTLLKSRHLLDRADLFRRHLIGLRSTDPAIHLPPLPVSLLLIDHIHDATELQLLWLKEQITAGVTVVMAGNDDLTAYTAAGAQDGAAFATITNWPGVSRVDLTDHYRQPVGLAPATYKIARFLAQRSGVPEGTGHNPTPAELVVKNHENTLAENRWLTEEALRYAAAGKTVGLLTPDDLTATVLTYLLAKTGAVAPQVANLARPLWEEPTAQAVLALLAVLFNQATTTQLALLLIAMGLPAGLVAGWVGQGLNGTGWLAADLPLPTGASEALPDNAKTRWPQIQRTLRYSWQALTSQALEPRTVFRAALSEILSALPASEPARSHEEKIALLAAETLLALEGDLAEALPKLVQEALPSAAAPLTVAPVRECRNMEFDVVLLAGLGTAITGATNLEHARHRFYLAATRSRQTLVLSHAGPPQPWVGELQQTFKNTQRLAK